MKKIALAAAAVLTLTGAAFAENQHFGNTDINAIAQQQQVDSVRTSSVGHDASAYNMLNPGDYGTTTVTGDINTHRFGSFDR